MQKLKDRGTGAVPPKKSASAYIIFGKEKRSEILWRNPLSKVTEVVKEIAKCWGLMSKEDKHKYKEAAKRGKSAVSLTLCRQGKILERVESSRRAFQEPLQAKEVLERLHDFCQRSK
jgi:HMG-box domain